MMKRRIHDRLLVRGSFAQFLERIARKMNTDSRLLRS